MPGFTLGARQTSDSPAGEGGAACHPPRGSVHMGDEGEEAWLAGPQTSGSERE